ncbi:MAG: carboxypeptidase regulatory-like domain-containing protein [Planctomycetota bacterium]|nr:carboxypeptidase regulatory-like domain-containing protein [Planctomycetota bacterium]
MSAPDAPDDLSLPPLIEGETIAGQVTDPQGVPLTGVRVEAAETGGADLDLLPVLTDGDGHFQVEGLRSGIRYDLRFSLGTVKARVLAVPTGTDQLHARLARPQGILLVVKTEPGLPPPALISVVLEREAKGKVIREWHGKTLRNRMLLWSIRPGRYTVKVWGGNYLPIEAHGVEVVAGQSAPEVEVVLGPEGGTVRGVVQGEAGAALEALVTWRRLDGPGHAPAHMRTVAADGDAAFVLKGLPEGRYRLAAWSRHAGLGRAEVDVVEGRSVPVELLLS